MADKSYMLKSQFSCQIEYLRSTRRVFSVLLHPAIKFGFAKEKLSSNSGMRDLAQPFPQSALRQGQVTNGFI
jgi:hypothetical protein